MERKHLEEILESHKKWLNDKRGGAEANLSETDLHGENLSGIDLSYSYLMKVNLSGACLRKATFCGANLDGANIKDADLRESDLRDACLSNVNLCGTNLRAANLRRANLNKADLRNANIEKADLVGTFLNKVKGLDYVISIKSTGPQKGETIWNMKNDWLISDMCTFRGTIDNFRALVEEKYKENPALLMEYRAVIRFFQEYKNRSQKILDS
jgi:uncharacterized protein YjbI with pentapeptide repeats